MNTISRRFAIAISVACALGALTSAAHANWFTDIANKAKAKALKALPIADINNRFFFKIPKINDPKIGKSDAFPTALRINVGKNSTGFPGGIGKIVHDAHFSGSPSFVFKVAFAAAAKNLLGKGNYANPNSIWYNVFFGFYEIDVVKSAWGRPFGYEQVGGKWQVRLEDVAHLGKSDWNHFSNQLYGVPAAAIKPYDVVNMSEIKALPVTRRTVGKRSWDFVQLAGMKMVGPYLSKSDGKKYVNLDPIVGPLWRWAFGTYDGQVAGKPSFLGTSMKAEIYMSFREERDAATGEQVYKTFFFGGTINELYPDKSENERFLRLQMKALEVIMRGESGLGFAR